MVNNIGLGRQPEKDNPIDRPRIRVDFNECVESHLVLLSKGDHIVDCAGTEIVLSEGLPVFIYEFNYYDDGVQEYLLADGVVELNNPAVNGEWTSAAKWCCRIDARGVRVDTR